MINNNSCYQCEKIRYLIDNFTICNGCGAEMCRHHTYAFDYYPFKIINRCSVCVMDLCNASVMFRKINA